MALPFLPLAKKLPCLNSTSQPRRSQKHCGVVCVLYSQVRPHNQLPTKMLIGFASGRGRGVFGTTMVDVRV